MLSCHVYRSASYGMTLSGVMNACDEMRCDIMRCDRTEVEGKDDKIRLVSDSE